MAGRLESDSNGRMYTRVVTRCVHARARLFEDPGPQGSHTA